MKTKTRKYEWLLVTIDVTLLLIVVAVIALRSVFKVAGWMIHSLG